MHRFLSSNRDELIARCKDKVAQRPLRAASERQLAHGVPMFLDQLTRTLAAEEDDEPALSIAISGPSGGDSLALSEIGVTATAHGKELLGLGYTVDQVVHDYGDLCQAITDLAFEQDAPFAVAEFRTLNRCLDNAIADAVTEFSFQRDAQISTHQTAAEKQRLGFLVHELRNSLGTATLAVRALELGNLGIGGATGAVLKRSLSTLGLLISRATAEVRAEGLDQRQAFSVASFIADVGLAARLDVNLKSSIFDVATVDPLLAVLANRELLHAALANLLQNAFKFTHQNSAVTLTAYAFGEHVLIDVEDHCGGLPPGGTARMFVPFKPNEDSRAGLGLGLSIARQSIEADHGTLTVRDVPGSGCIFTISLPRYTLQ
ncbi:HAMP domain-containing sensor histidine kinase [Variovorax sp. RTB1]|nr:MULTISPECIES: HAMP domain-containing sensor histidine kinase [unclassified Variovorax]MEB0058139.1 HAMP domain-containing sensor histidine kinase [Variovorax sp. LG9.2]MEB0112143.1 HAMP domain-containing sensor histidine kinase [Variovorax sp. RTB1]